MPSAVPAASTARIGSSRVSCTTVETAAYSRRCRSRTRSGTGMSPRGQELGADPGAKLVERLGNEIDGDEVDRQRPRLQWQQPHEILFRRDHELRSGRACGLRDEYEIFRVVAMMVAEGHRIRDVPASRREVVEEP